MIQGMAALRMTIHATTRDPQHMGRAHGILRGAAAQLGVETPDIEEDGAVWWSARDVFEVEHAMTETDSEWRHYFVWG